MADIKEVIKEVVTTIYPSPRKLKETGMADDLGKFQPIASYSMMYDAQQNQLEPIYYWILDFMQDMGLKVKKITDNFTSSPGSGHFAEMGQRATRMQEEGMKILGGLNQTIKSALNLVYDLKEFKMRLKHYDDYTKHPDPKVRNAAFLALKQVWLDSVDLPKRGDGSIHGLAQKVGYTTVREAFMYARTLEDLDEMAKEGEGIINESVARIIRPRLKEFFDWIGYSESELRKRFNIERSYLKSQIGTIKLYAAWVRPYLKAAEELRQSGFDDDAALVNAFSTSMFQLTLLATTGGSASAVTDKVTYPIAEKNISPKGREYRPYIVIDFKYRGHLLQKANQRGDFAPAFGGRVDISFDCYALNSQEIQLIKKKLADAELKETLTLEGDYAIDAINELEEDLREFLGDEDVDKVLKKDREKVKEKKQDDINPFAALASLFTIFSSNKKSNKKDVNITDAKQIKPDNWTEKLARINAATDASGRLYTIYDIYKKAHGMASSPTPFENGEINEPSTYFSDVWRSDWQ